jgi:hypothetical protein
MAEASNAVVHPSVDWEAMEARNPQGFGVARYLAPPRGSLPAAQRNAVAEVLSRHTRAPQSCYFGIWEGYGDVVTGGAVTFEIPHRSMALFHGDLSCLVMTFSRSRDQSANLSWPEGKEWCVATDIDLDSTYVGGSVECVHALLEDERLEGFTVIANQRITRDADGINT